MHRLTLNTLVGMLALTTSGSEPNKIKVNNNQPAAKYRVINNCQTVNIDNPCYAGDPPKHGLTIIRGNPLKVKISKKTTLVASTTPKSPEVQPPIKLSSSASATGLIKSTDGKHRAEQVQQGRTDPFSGLTTPLPVEPTPKPQKVFPKLPQLPVAKEQIQAPPLPAKPELPKTDLAKAIAVEGVMGIGDERHAIVKLPHDVSSRYVAEGQELLGGRVLVKAIKIDATNSEDPTVIFEQNGVEVAASVGFKPDNKNNTGLTESDSTVASTSSPMSILTADVAAKRVSSKPIDEVAYHPPSSSVSSTSPDSPLASPDSQGIKAILSPAALLPELKAQNTRGEPYQQQPINSKSVSVALNELPRAKKLSAPQSVDLKPRSEYSETYSPTITKLSSTERYKQLVYRLRYGRERPAQALPVVHEANTEFRQQSFEQLISDGRELGNNGEDARATSSSQLNQEQKAKAYRQLVDRLRYRASEVNR